MRTPREIPVKDLVNYLKIDWGSIYNWEKQGLPKNASLEEIKAWLKQRSKLPYFGSTMKRALEILQHKKQG